MIRRLVSRDVMRSLAFTTNTFVRSEPTSVALKLTSCDFMTAFQDVMKKCVESGFSYAMVENDVIIAQSLSVSYDVFSKARYGHTAETQPMFDLFEQLEVWKPDNHEKCLVVFAISSDIEGRGLASRLLAETISRAKDRGFERIIGDCTNYKSQNMFAKHGFETVANIRYKDFSYGVRKPFENIDTRDIRRMVLHLRS